MADRLAVGARDVLDPALGDVGRGRRTHRDAGITRLDRGEVLHLRGGRHRRAEPIPNPAKSINPASTRMVIRVVVMRSPSMARLCAGGAIRSAVIGRRTGAG